MHEDTRTVNTFLMHVASRSALANRELGCSALFCGNEYFRAFDLGNQWKGAYQGIVLFLLHTLTFRLCFPAVIALGIP
jgi:hypothetical protein